MDFENQLNAIVETIAERKTLVNTEEATKMTFIMPFLKTLGYDVFNPSIVFFLDFHVVLAFYLPLK
nr:hypothetical protein [Campylobacter jejuni]